MDEKKCHYQTVWNGILASQVDERENEVLHYILKFEQEC